MTQFKCIKCGVDKPFTLEFFAKGDGGLPRRTCKPCRAAQKRVNRNNETPEQRERRLAMARKYQKTHEEELKPKRAAYFVKYRDRRHKYDKARYAASDKEEQRVRLREWRRNNREHKREQNRLWALANPDKALQSSRKSKKRRRQSIAVRLSESISAQVWQSLKGHKNGARWQALVGYSLDELTAHLERQFKDGMSWENYGRHGWHIDHIIPQDSFAFSSVNDDQFKACWSLENLQPLWAVDNLRKRNRLDWKPQAMSVETSTGLIC